MQSKSAHHHGKNRGPKKHHGQKQVGHKTKPIQVFVPKPVPAASVAAKPLAAAPSRQPAQRAAANDATSVRMVRDTANIPPAGYRLVDDDFYEITKKDMVFVGGRHPYWMPARRAGEIGSLRRFSTVAAVARLAA
ncbi:hypothetical protein ABIC83_002940 [Roseateles asaccharophilus]|uniref:hypothetical protein n=1 Tax=Roseateles asaccharophilus TaxID=582607 RepID=UPI0038335E2B